MNKVLGVYLDQTQVGKLQQDIHGKNSFTSGVQDQHLEKLQTLIEKRSIAVAQIFG